MAKEKNKDKTELKKGVAKFELIGKLKLNNFSFVIDEKAKKTNSDWVYNRMNLLVDCGGGNDVSCELMGGYGTKRDNLVYVHGKKQSEKDKEKFVDDFENQFTIAWEDRFDEKVLLEVGNSSFIRVGIEKDKDGKIYTEKFVSSYDVIKYVSQHKDEINDKVVRINGDIKYKVYNGSLQRVKEIKSIYISAVEEKDFKAEFTQTILIDKQSYGKKDKETNLIDISAWVVDFAKDYDGKDITVNKKGINVPFVSNMYIENEKLEKIFKVKKDITEIAVIGKIIEGRQKAVIEYDDLDSDMQMLIDTGAYTLETLAKTISIKGEKVVQWIITAPVVKMVGEGDEKTPVISRTEEKYKSDDLILEFLIEKEETNTSEDATDDSVKASDDDLDDLLNNL